MSLPADPEAVLFISLGTSPAVVPEAFLMPDISFGAVHVLTTERPEVDLIQDFFRRHAPKVNLTISRVAGFTDFITEADHFRFEETLYRWVLASGASPLNRYFCLSGGFKTMSAAVQKAASVLGAAEVFHVLADGGSGLPSTIDEILAAKEQEHLHWIRLGSESGWPQLREARPADYPLVVIREENGIGWLRTEDDRFRARLSQIVERSHHIADAWDQLSQLPFAVLATWSAADLAWIRQPVNPEAETDRNWVASLPKVELHCHLGGFATSGELLDQVRLAAIHPEGLPPNREIQTPPDWPAPGSPVGLEHYRNLGDNNGSRLLRDPGCLRRQCELLYEHLVQQHVVYAEIRCSPANYADAALGRSPWEVLTDIRDTFQSCMARAAIHAGAPVPACRVNLIIIGTRQTGGDYRAGIARHLALAVTAAEHWPDSAGCRVVGVDLAGYEDVTTRAHYFREEFTAVHRCGLALTVHAGENDDAEGIWRAVFDLNARRLGHALSLSQSPELLRSVADRGIGIEMCPYANLQIRGFQIASNPALAGNSKSYPLLQYLRAGAKVTVNTDNIGISAATLTDNLLLAAHLCPGLARLDLLRLQRNALDSAFLAAEERNTIIGHYADAIPFA